MPETALKPHLPKSWPATVRSAMLHVISLAKYAAVFTRSARLQAASPFQRLRRGGRELLRLDGAGYPGALLFSPDARLLASGNNDTAATVWDVAGVTRRGQTPR